MLLLYLIIITYNSRHFPAGIWNHLVITWNVADGAKVYINGMSAGISSQHRVQHVFSKPQRPVLTLGGSAYGFSWQRGAFDTLWLSVLWRNVANGRLTSGFPH